jgi:hypothetical protein
LPSLKRILLILILFGITADSFSLDLSDTSPQDLRAALLPIGTVIATEQTPPSPLVGSSQKPLFALGGTFYSFGMPVTNSTAPGYPSLWLAISVSPNLTLGGNLAGFNWLDDNIQSVGPFISTSWGNDKKFINATLNIHHLKGPDDFHIRDIAISLSRTIKYSKWLIAAGYTTHFMQFKIHIKESLYNPQGYQTIKNIDQGFLRLSAFRQLGKSLQIGDELYLSTKSIMTNLVLLLHF